MGRRKKITYDSERKRVLQHYQLDNFVGYSPSGSYIGKYSKQSGALRYAGPDIGSLYAQNEEIHPVRLVVDNEFNAVDMEQSGVLDGYWGVLRFRDGKIIGVYEGFWKSSSFWRNWEDVRDGGLGEFVKVRVEKIKNSSTK